MLAATAIMFGTQAESVMENPVLESVSPSEFWGKRWNKLIHGVLKVTVNNMNMMQCALPKAIYSKTSILCIAI